jgi:hypothetical protein
MERIKDLLSVNNKSEITIEIPIEFNKDCPKYLPKEKKITKNVKISIMLILIEINNLSRINLGISSSTP